MSDGYLNHDADPSRPLLPDVSVFTAIRDRSGDIVDFVWSYANVGASALTGYAPTELIGHTFLDVLPDHGPTGMFEICRNLVETETLTRSRPYGPRTHGTTVRGGGVRSMYERPRSTTASWSPRER